MNEEIKEKDLRKPIGMDYKTTVEIHLAIIRGYKEKIKELEKEIKSLKEDLNIQLWNEGEKLNKKELLDENNQLKQQLKEQPKNIFDEYAVEIQEELKIIIDEIDRECFGKNKKELHELFDRIFYQLIDIYKKLKKKWIKTK